MWSNQRTNKVYDNSNYIINIRCRTTNVMLGSMPNNPDLFREFIVSKNPNADERELEQALAMEPFNTDEQMALAQRFKIAAIPALFVVKDGEVVNKSVGAIPKEQIEALIK